MEIERKKKYKIKYKNIYLILIPILIIFIIISIFKTKNYEVEYNLDKYKIVESYSKEDKQYMFKVSYDKYKFSFISNKKYNKKHKLITDISIEETEEEKCLIIKDFENEYLCFNENEEIDVYTTSEEMQEKLGLEKINQTKQETYLNYDIYNLIDDKYLIWNYKGLDIISGNKKNTIELFDTGVYDIPVSVLLDKYFVIADYESKYNFDKFYIINVEKQTKEEWKIKYNISHDSYVLGTNNKSVFIVDKTNKVEYELVPSKKKIRIVGTSYKKGTILTEKGFESIGLSKLSSDIHSFYDNNKYNYYIKDNKLYQELNGCNKKISNKEVNYIVSTNLDKVYYLIDKSLYMYDNKKGEVQIMSNFEWNFNYKNMIYNYNS